MATRPNMEGGSTPSALSIALLQPRENWPLAKARWEMAQVDFNNADTDSDEDQDFYGEAYFTALKSMMLARAPDAAALTYKLESFRDEGCGRLNHDDAEAIINTLIADAKALVEER